MVRDELARKQSLDQVDRLLEPVEALAEAAAEVEPEGVVLTLEPRAADPEHEPAAREVVERRRHLRGESRVPERVRGDEVADPRASRQRGESSQRSPALELRIMPVALVGEEVIVQPEAVETRGLGGQAGVAEVGPARALDPEGGAELHRPIVGT